MLRKRVAAVSSDSDTDSASKPLLSVRALTVAYRLPGVDRFSVSALTDINFDIFDGDTVGIFGESGCGKTTLLLSVLNLLRNETLTSGSVWLEGRDLMASSEQYLRTVRGSQIGMVMQEAGTALNPVRTIGEQTLDVLRAHKTMSKAAYRECVHSSLESVGLPSQRAFKSLPHQLSGGERQRVLIAQALLCGPTILLADEPVHALDSDSRDAIIQLLKSQTEDSKMSLLISSHDPAVLRKLTRRLCVFYAGQLIESGLTEEVLTEPRHPYTRALVNCFHIPKRFAGEARAKLRTIPGLSPRSNDGMNACRFESRCSSRQPACSSGMPPLLPIELTREVRCILHANH